MTRDCPAGTWHVAPRSGDNLRMESTQTQTQSLSVIEPRDLRFDLSDVPKAWHGGQLSVSLFFDALSVFFPEGERFFVKSVKTFKDDPRVDIRLKAEAAAFCAQE